MKVIELIQSYFVYFQCYQEAYVLQKFTRELIFELVEERVSPKLLLKSHIKGNCHSFYNVDEWMHMHYALLYPVLSIEKILYGQVFNYYRATMISPVKRDSCVISSYE